ncbi:MAG: endonuclease III [Proteobacteria bacterium]|nr:endonuclease III [Pseudomonadota bacterium]
MLEKSRERRNAPVITLMANLGAGPFEVLASTVLSLRTKDEVTAKASKRLFEKARSPEDMLTLDEKTIEKLIYPVGFYKTKAKNLIKISRILVDEYQSVVPDDIDELLKLPGVGRKTANLVLVEGYKKDAVCVDTHVHRISNRIGYVTTKTPDQTEFELRKKLPRKYWIRYNEYLVAYGQTICKPVSPFCSKCEAEGMCPKTGVTKFR